MGGPGPIYHMDSYSCIIKQDPIRRLEGAERKNSRSKTDPRLSFQPDCTGNGTKEATLQDLVFGLTSGSEDFPGTADPRS